MRESVWVIILGAHVMRESVWVIILGAHVMRESVWVIIVGAHVVDRVWFDVIPDLGGKATKK